MSAYQGALNALFETVRGEAWMVSSGVGYDAIPIAAWNRRENRNE